MPLVGPALIGDAGAGTTIHRQAWGEMEGDPKLSKINGKTMAGTIMLMMKMT
jgi:hypothetical protein